MEAVTPSKTPPEDVIPKYENYVISWDNFDDILRTFFSYENNPCCVNGYF